MLAVKVSVPVCMPAAVGLPRNHSAEPVDAGRLVIVGIHEDWPGPLVMTRPWAVSGSALMTWMLTWAPAGTVILGLTMPAMRNVSPGPPGRACQAAPTHQEVQYFPRSATGYAGGRRAGIQREQG